MRPTGSCGATDRSLAYAGDVGWSLRTARRDSSPPVRTTGLGAGTLLVLALIAVVVRVLYVVLAVRGYAPTSDGAHYNDIARKVSEGRGIASQFPYLWTHPTAFRPPLYPVLLGGMYFLFGVHIAVAQVLNVALGTGVVVLTAVLGSRLGGRTAGLVAGGVATVHPALLAGDAVILTEPLALLLMLATLLLLDRERWAWAGLFAGLMVLTRPSAQLYVPVIGLYLLVSFARRSGWLRRRRTRQQVGARAGLGAGLRAAVVFGLVAVVAVLPWVVRNEIELGKPVIVTSNGFNLAAIWSPLALHDDHFIDPVMDTRNDGVTRFHELENLDEASLDTTLRKEGLDGLKANPGRIPRIVGRNVLYLFDYHWRGNDNAERLDGRNITFRHRTLPFVWLVLLVGAVGFVLMRRRRLGVLIVLTAAYMAAVSVVTVSPPRLRAPVDVLCCVGVGVVVAEIRRRRKRPAASGVDEAALVAPLAEVGRI